MELDEYLRDIAEDARESKEARRLALEMLASWNAGIIPSQKKLHRLREITKHPGVCARLQEDGRCPWLRRHAHLEGHRLPEPGEVVYCHRRGSETEPASYESCAGFKKREDD